MYNTLKSCKVPLRKPIPECSSILLRDYQKDAVKAVHEAIKAGIRRPAVVLSTGGGKTVVFSYLIPQLKPLTPQQGNKTLVLAHKEELVQQAASTIQRISPDLKVDIDMRKLKPTPDADVIVASVPTLVRATRLHKYDPSEFKAIIVDECHHATAQSWTKILECFGAHTPNLKIAVLGFTATFERTDGDYLSKVFDQIVYQRKLEEMIQNKELAEIIFSVIEAKLDLSRLKMRYGDYETTMLAKHMMNPDVIDTVALSYLKLRKQFSFKRTLIFCVSIEHCKVLCAVLRSQGINAQYVSGETAKHERQAIIEDFKNGIISVLCNVQVFTEGTDIPSIDSVFLARPTRSRVLLTQMIGRGLRLCEGKTHCHIVDIADTTGIGLQSAPEMMDLPPNYNINAKTYTQLVKERAHEAEVENEKEFIEMQEKLKKLKLLKDSIDDIDMKIKTLDGFTSIISGNADKFEDSAAVSDEFYNSRLRWVRLEYDVWGVQGESLDFILVRRSYLDDRPLFEAEMWSFTSINQLKMSRFRSVKKSMKYKFGTKSSNLRSVLVDCEQEFFKYNKSKFFKTASFYKLELTNAQYDLLLPKFTAQVKKNYKDQKLLETLAEKLKTMSRSKAGGLIFAFKYSVNSICIRWELNLMLGPDKYVESKKLKLEKLAKLMQ